MHDVNVVPARFPIFLFRPSANSLNLPQTSPILQFLVAEAALAADLRVHRLDVQNDLVQHDGIADSAFPPRFVQPLGVLLLDVLDGVEAGFAGDSADRTCVLRWSVASAC